MIILIRDILLLFAILLLFSCQEKWLPPEENIEPLSSEYKHQTIEKLNKMMLERYVDIKLAENFVTRFDSLLSSGFFNNIDSLAQFKKAIEEQGYLVLGDAHFFLKTREQMDGNLKERKNPKESRKSTSKILEGNIGYVDLQNFVLNKGMIKDLMEPISSSDVCIIDLRNNTGGCPRCVRNISNYFFEEKTHLNTIFWRKGNKLKPEESWTNKISNKKLTDKEVYILTSKRTASAAEEFAYNLQVRKRAKIVGEKSRGACNPGGIFQINGNLFAFISDGKSINPITNKNWNEGLIPDIHCDSDNALIKVLETLK